MFSHKAGVFSPDDLDMLERVLVRANPVGSALAERENTAAKAVALFISGIVTEEDLAAELTAGNDRTPRFTN